MYKNTNVQKKGKGEITFLIKVSTTFYKKKNSISKWLAEKYYLARYFSIWLMLPVVILLSLTF